MSSFFNEKFQDLEAYIPGEQPKDQTYIKLNANENPYPPSPGVLEVINESSVRGLNKYPDSNITRMKMLLAEHFQVQEDNVFVSNGSDESLAMAFMAFCDRDGIVFPSITYSFYIVYAELFGLAYREIPLEKDFSIQIEDYINIHQNIIIANPNAPSGLALSRAEIEEIVQSNPENLVMIDEAYVNFGGETAVPLIQKYDNLLVIHTFSKSHSLAGARLGFAIGNEEIIGDLEKIRNSINPYNVNSLSMLAGEQAILDHEYYMAQCQRIMDNRKILTDELRKFGFKVLDSKGNFILVEPRGILAKSYYQALRKKGILIRYFGTDQLKDYVRITIGSEEQVRILLERTEEILENR